jgi:DNA-binding SARP family transcriptional activator
VVDGVGMAVDSNLADRATRSVAVRLLGPVAIHRHGVPLALPASRKVRGLLAYLCVAPNAVTRGQLCELLWEVPNDPRGELRWCLSKIRSLVDEPGRRRVVTNGDTVMVDLMDCVVDALEIAQVTRDTSVVAPERLRVLAGLFAGDFLEGLEIDRSPSFNGWVTAQRRRFRDCHTAVLQRLVEIVPDHEARQYLEKWLVLAPFDQRVHEMLLNGLARRGQIREGEEHLAATTRLFESEGLDCTPIREAWRLARAQRDIPPPAQAVVPGSSPAAYLEPREGVTGASRRVSIAVMPFADRSSMADSRGGTADGLADDIITRLAKLRSLFVIAQGSVFALHERRIGPEEAGRMLNVDYVACGSVRSQGNRIIVTVELTETHRPHHVGRDL